MTLPGLTARQRYEMKVDRSGGPDECHPWTAATTVKMGYGHFWSGTDVVIAHRWGYEHGVGADAHGDQLGILTPGAHVCHTCDNPPCQNQRHWFAGTQAANNQDCVTKGRHRHTPAKAGAGHHNVRLTPSQVSSIRSRYAAGNISQRRLAAEYGVAQQHVSRIVNHLKWSASESQGAS